MSPHALAGEEDALPDWKHDQREFAAALRTRAATADHVFDPRRRRRVPQIDASSALRSMNGSWSSPSLLVALVLAILALVVNLTHSPGALDRSAVPQVAG